MDFRLLGAFLVVLGQAHPALGQIAGGKNIELVVPGAAGGQFDAIARAVAPRLESELGRKVVIVNRPGAGEGGGLRYLAKAPGDGSVIGVSSIASLYTPSGLPSFRPSTDLSAVGLLGTAPSILVTGTRSEIQSLKGLLEMARAKPDKVVYASAGLGSASYLLGQQLASAASVKMIHVPYKGSAPAMMDLVGGQASALFLTVPDALRWAKEGKVRLLAISSAKRSPLAPDVPTIAESGVPGFDASTSIGVLAPPGVPASIIQQLNGAVAKVLATGEVKERLGGLGVEASSTSPQQFANLIRKESELLKWASISPDGPSFPTAAPPPPPPPPPIVAAPEPPLPKPAEPGVPVVPAMPGGSIVPAYWNAWLASDGKERRRLVRGEQYRFSVDLSRISYGKGMSAGVGPEIDEWLRRHSSKSELPITLHAVLLGRSLTFAHGTPATQQMTIRMDRLRADSTQDETAKASLRRYQAGQIGIDVLSSQVAADTVTFEVQAYESGCASIVVSIWDALMSVPLDSLVHHVEVVENESHSLPGCAPPGGDQRLRGGAATFFGAVLDESVAGSIDAALHVFEFPAPGSDKWTVAVFVDRARYLSAPKGAWGTQRGIHSWRLMSSMSDALGKDDEILLLIRAAREKAVKNASDAYADVAAELRQRLFTAERREENEAAGAALASLQTLVRNSEKQPVLLARMYSADGSLLYMPLGLLSANSANPVLSKRITVVQPLPRERYRSSSSCVESWTFGIPTVFTGSTQISLSPTAQQTRGNWLRTIPDLRGYLGSSSSPQSPGRGEGLLLLAHHSDGKLWFESSAERVLPQSFRREFAPGSVAILSACSMAGAESGNRAILDLLNRRNVDAIVASPFPVDAQYGTQLARDFIDVIREQSSKPAPMTIAHVLQLATERTAAYFRAERPTVRYEDMALEFLIAGDHTLRLCGASGPR
jgi:tripartite-type tricarboxylate transporter receptor subunit TctC